MVKKKISLGFSCRDVTTGVNGTTTFAPKFSDTLTLFQVSNQGDTPLLNDYNNVNLIDQWETYGAYGPQASKLIKQIGKKNTGSDW